MPEIADFIDSSGFPITLAFSKSGRALFSERITGNLWEILGKEKYRLVKHFPIVQVTGHHETGLLGITLDPDFDSNGCIYCFYTYGNDIDHCENRVVRIDADGSEEILLDHIPAGRIHNGGILIFGADKKLYISVGVQNEIKEKAQDIKWLGGKVLRINPDGSIPEDNPFPNSPVYSYGHRNIFGLAVQSETGKLFAAEDGPDHDDEINIIEKGGNYGWPEVMGKSGEKKYIDPIVTYTPTITPTQSVFYEGKLYFGSYNEGSVHCLDFDDKGKVVKDEVVYSGKSFGAIGVFVSPTGQFYVATPNRILNVELETK